MVVLLDEHVGIGPQVAPPQNEETWAEFSRDLARFGIGQGALMGGGDEAEAFARSKTTGRNYEEVLGEVRGELKEFRKIHPYWALGAEMIGGAVVPGGAMMKGATLGAKALRGGVASGAYGAGYGFGTGEDGFDNRAANAVAGGVTGAVMGAVVPPLAAGGKALLNKAGQALAPGMAMFQKGKPEARTVSSAIERDAQLGDAGLSEAEFIAAQQRGQPVTTMEMGGNMTRDLARTAGNLSDEGRSVISQTVDDRYISQSPRVTGFLSKMIGGRKAGEIQDGLQEAARRANKPAYERAYSQGQAVWSEKLATLTSDPHIQKAISQAESRGKTKAVIEGFSPTHNPFTKTADGSYALRTNPDGSRALPNLQFWDHVKRGLDARHNKLKKAGDKDAARDVDSLRKMLNSELDEMVPSYKEARAGAALFFGAEDALEAGAKAATTRLSNAEIKKGLGKMKPAERKLFASGFVTETIEGINRAADSRDVVKMIYQSPQARERIQMVMGKKASGELEAFLRVEGLMQMTREAVKGNSRTAQYLMDAGILATGAAASGGLDFTDPANILAGAMVGGRRYVNRKFATNIAKMLVSEDPKQHQLGMSLLSRNSRLMDALRVFDGKIARLSGQQGAQIPEGKAP